MKLLQQIASLQRAVEPTCKLPLCIRECEEPRPVQTVSDTCMHKTAVMLTSQVHPDLVKGSRPILHGGWPYIHKANGLEQSQCTRQGTEYLKLTGDPLHISVTIFISFLRSIDAVALASWW